MLAPEDAPGWVRLGVDMLAGGAAGLVGALARELNRNDRSFSLALVPLTIGGAAMGSGVFVVARGMTDNDAVAFGVAFSVGVLGQAALTDLLRGWLRQVLRVDRDPATRAPGGRRPHDPPG